MWGILVFFAKNVILSCLLAFLASFIVGAYIFYSSIVLASRNNFDSMDSSLDIRKDHYDSVLAAWEKEGQKRQGIGSASYRDIFFAPAGKSSD